MCASEHFRNCAISIRVMVHGGPSIGSSVRSYVNVSHIAADVTRTLEEILQHDGFVFSSFTRPVDTAVHLDDPWRDIKHFYTVGSVSCSQ